jgi:hypothetical protein
MHLNQKTVGRIIRRRRESAGRGLAAAAAVEYRSREHECVPSGTDARLSPLRIDHRILLADTPTA